MADVHFIKAQCMARGVGDSAHAAYWDAGNEDFHDRAMHRSFVELADFLGYSVERLPLAVEMVEAAQ